MAEAERPVDLTGVRVLVIEDDDLTADVLARMASSFGASVTLARDGHAAVEAVARAAPDVILCDLRLPGMDGFQFMDWLRAQPEVARIPVVAVTALASDADVMRTWTAGFAGHLVKPFDRSTLGSQLQRLFAARRP